MRSLANLFGPSPFRPLQDHMEKAVSCAQEVTGLVGALIAGDTADLAARQERTAALESECDEIKNKLRAHLPRRLFLPVDRRDLLEVLDLQDSIADAAEDVGDLLVMRAWVVPADMRAPLKVLAASVVAAAEGAGRVMDHLDELVETAFVGPELARTEKLIEEVQTLEADADRAEDVLLRLLFQHEDEVGAVGVLMWLRLIETMGDVADFSKKSCNRLRLLIAR
ncbi:MAG: TIGR00153 family protein [Deltaproteobacteria bacterium]|nr:TIGR00153 family protein [Deltaproteobacteria bacterium]